MPPREDQDEEQDEIRIQRIKRRPKTGPTSVAESEPSPTGLAPEASDKEDGPGKLLQFLRRLGPALSATQLPQFGTDSPVSSLGGILQGLAAGGQSFVGGREAIEQDRNSRAIASIRNSPAFTGGIDAISSGTALTAEQQTALRLGLQPGDQPGFQDPAVLGTKEAGDVIKAGPLVPTPKEAADIAAGEARTGLERDLLETVQQPQAAAAGVQAEAAVKSQEARLVEAQAEIERIGVARQQASNQAERNSLLGEELDLRRRVAAIGAVGQIVNDSPDPEATGLAIQNVVDEILGIASDATPADRQLVAGLTRIPQETLKIQRDRILNTENVFVERTRKLATKVFGSEEAIPNRVDILIGQLGFPGVLARAGQDQDVVDKLSELESLLDASAEPGAFLKLMGTLFSGITSNVFKAAGEVVQEAQRQEAAEPTLTRDEIRNEIAARLNKNPEDLVDTDLTEEEFKRLEAAQ